MGNAQEAQRKKHGESGKSSHRSVNSNVESFFNSNGLKESEVSVGQILGCFSNSFIIRRILINFTGQSDHQRQDDLHQKVPVNKIKEIFSELVDCYFNSAIVEFYVNLLFCSPDGIDYEFLEKVFYDCFHFALRSAGFQDAEMSIYSKKTLNAISRSIQSQGEKTSQSEIKNWILSEFPLVFHGFHHWAVNILKSHKPEVQFEKANDLSEFLNLVTIWYLISNLPNCYTKDLASEHGSLIEKLKNCLVEKRWRALYQSENHGLSLNRFQTNLFNYKAGTIVFIFCQTGSLYCVCSNQEYKESPTAYGDDQTRIFRLWDDFKIFEVATNGNIFLNTKSRFLKLGLIFGYSNSLKPVMKINEDFHSIEHDLKNNDTIISVEGWGCGTSKASLDQQSMKNWEKKQIEKMRTVKRGAGWDEDKTILDLAGVKTEHSERGDI